MNAGPAEAVVILTALELEYEVIRQRLVDPRPWRHPAGTFFEVGRLPDRPGTVAIAVTGAGPQAAAVLTERAISQFRPRAVLFVGIAGALHDDIALGDVVVATKIYGYHGGAEESDGFRARPQAWEAAHELEQIARLLSRTWSWNGRPVTKRPASPPPHIHFRPVAAGEVVLNSRDTPLAKQLSHAYNDAAAIEMESSGTAKAAHLSSVPMLTIRGISDKADGLKRSSDDAGWQRTAAANAASFGIGVAGAILDISDHEEAAGEQGRAVPDIPALPKPWRALAHAVIRRPAAAVAVLVLVVTLGGAGWLLRDFATGTGPPSHTGPGGSPRESPFSATVSAHVRYTYNKASRRPIGVNVYPNPAVWTKETGAYNEGDPLTIECKRDGRTVNAGSSYPLGPGKTSHVWYRINQAQWIISLYVVIDQVNGMTPTPPDC